MKLSKIEVGNFRLLKERFNLELKDELSLVIGKNNTGKTSLLQILQRFLGDSNTFNFEDFSLSCQKNIIDILNQELEEESFEEPCLWMKLYITFDNEKDNLAHLSDLIVDLDPNNTTILFEFRYFLSFEKYQQLKVDFEEHKLGEDKLAFLKKQHKAYFAISKEVVNINDEQDRLPVVDAQIRNVINLQYISAKRDVMNEDGDNNKSNKTLSKLSYRYYKPSEKSNEDQVLELQKALITTDKTLTENYSHIFSDIVQDVQDFSYDGAKIEVKSNFEEVNLMRENTSVVYENHGHQLPEDYNGLGYMNLFSMIFELHIIFNEFKRTFIPSGHPSEINLLFIEEPEAHTHPQMQYVFIKKIKEFLNRRKEGINLQTIITTHSSHITSQSDFDDIRYFLNHGDNIEVKNLTDLASKYAADDASKANFKFLKKYLTLSRAELFFTDKAVIIEGDTERLLLPAMMYKLDKQNEAKEDYKKPLLSQNISIVEVGAHAKVFEHFLDFLEIKTLIITDVDYSKKEERGENKDGSKRIKDVASSPEEAEGTTNATLKYFFNNPTSKDLQELTDEGHIVELPDSSTPVYIAFQGEENGHYARSFEDAFLSSSPSLQFIKDRRDEFMSLKWKDDLDDNTLSAFEIANKCIRKKTEFATDILYLSDDTYSQWETPNYINKGLIWLQQD